MGSFENARAVLRESALTFVAADTGSLTLGLTTTAITRSTGSFLADGFKPGMEVQVSGYPFAIGPFVLKSVTALELTPNDASELSLQSPASGRRVLCPWLAQSAWENWTFAPDEARPYVRERLMPQEQFRLSLGPKARVQVGGSWLLDFFFPASIRGTAGPDAYVDSLAENHFYPGVSLVRNNQQVLVVNSTRSGGRVSAGWYMIPFILRFKTHFITPL